MTWRSNFKYSDDEERLIVPGKLGLSSRLSGISVPHHTGVNASINQSVTQSCVNTCSVFFPYSEDVIPINPFSRKEVGLWQVQRKRDNASLIICRISKVWHRSLKPSPTRLGSEMNFAYILFRNGIKLASFSPMLLCTYISVDWQLRLYITLQSYRMVIGAYLASFLKENRKKRLVHWIKIFQKINWNAFLDNRAIFCPTILQRVSA